MAPDAPVPVAAGAGRQTIWNQVPRGDAAATSAAALSSACSCARLRASGAGVPKTSESQGVPPAAATARTAAPAAERAYAAAEHGQAGGSGVGPGVGGAGWEGCAGAGGVDG